MIKINFIIGLKQKSFSALSKVAFCLQQSLPQKILKREISVKPFFSGGFWEELTNFFYYPLYIKKRLKSGEINHITSQEYAYLLNIIQIPNALITIHDIFPLTFDKKRTHFNYKFRIWWGLQALKKAKQLVCVSEYTKKEIIKLGFDKNEVKVVPDGIDLDTYFKYKKGVSPKIYKKYNLRRDRIYILYHGSEISRKNCGVLIEAFKLINKKYPKTVLIKTGLSQDNLQHTLLLNKVRRAGLEEKVLFLGYIPEEDMPKVYNIADIFIFPSLAEGFGMPVLEAMACGCPVISSNMAALPEVVGDAGILINPKPKNIFLAVDKLLKNSTLYKHYSLKGINRAKKFSWQSIARDYVKIYEDILKK